MNSQRFIIQIFLVIVFQLLDSHLLFADPPGRSHQKHTERRGGIHGMQTESSNPNQKSTPVKLDNEVRCEGTIDDARKAIANAKKMHPERDDDENFKYQKYLDLTKKITPKMAPPVTEASKNSDLVNDIITEWTTDIMTKVSKGTESTSPDRIQQYKADQLEKLFNRDVAEGLKKAAKDIFKDLAEVCP